MTRLPIHAHADAIRAQLAAHRRLILSAPPGTGKSTQVPQFLLPESGTALVLQPRRIAARSLADWDRSRAEELLVSKLASGEVGLVAMTEEVEQLVRRIRIASEVWPEARVPALDPEDWELICHVLAAGKASPDEITASELTEVLREMVGWEAMARIEREAPRSMRLPSGRTARITYFEGAPPELSARLGDMLGMQGTLSLFEGRVPLLFDILAPNFRTVQKTYDLTGFWQNTYPEVKKELKRRYPKHPWP